jgi:hypothetical protein
MRKSWRMAIVAISIASLAFAACGDDDNDDEADDTTTAPTEEPADDTTTTTEPEATGPTLTVEPTDGLTDGQTVTVTASGFTATDRLVFGETAVGINLCVDKGENTGAGDCNLAGIVAPTVDADGGIPPTEYTVVKGPFGSNNVTCGVEGPCVISVGELVAEADAQRTNVVEITFAE